MASCDRDETASMRDHCLEGSWMNSTRARTSIERKRPFAARRVYSECRWRPTALALLSTAFFLTGCDAQILCPFLKAPAALNGVEDVAMNVADAWRETQGEGVITRPAFRMYHLHAADCQYADRRDITDDKLNWDAPPNSKDAVVLTVSVQIGRVWLSVGYHRCNGTVINDANFTESVGTLKSFEVEGLFHQVNCMMQYIVFESLVDGNSDVHMANIGLEPLIMVRVGPRCKGGPIICGANYESESEVTTTIHLTAVNDAPMLESCPTTKLSKNTTTEAANGCENPENILSWGPKDGDSTCQSVSTVVGGPVIRDPPISAGAYTRDPVSNSCQGPHVGTKVSPTRIVPAFCQIEDLNLEDPPHCSLYKERPYCLANKTSFVYHIEDEADAKLQLNGMRVHDADLWAGYVTMHWTLRFQPAVPPARLGENDPIPDRMEVDVNVENLLGNMNYFCAKPKFNREKRAGQWREDNSDYCSAQKSDSLGGVFVPKDEFGKDSYDQLFIKVVPSATRPPDQCNIILDATPRAGFEICSDNLNADFEVESCTCKTRVYLLQEGDTEADTKFYSVFFYEIRERDNLDLFETGYFTLVYNRSEVIEGKVYAEKGAQPWPNDQFVDLFMAQPFITTGTVSFDGGAVIMELVVKTAPEVNPRFNVELSTKSGSVSVPEAKVPLQQDDPTKKSFLGTIDEVNEAISSVVYELPADESFHTMARRHSLYGAGKTETVSITIDDRGFSGALPDGGSTSSLFEFDVVVVADNDPPEVQNALAEEQYTVQENTWSRLEGFSIADDDATDILINVQDKSPIEAKMTLSCGHGTVRVSPLALQNVHVAAPLHLRCENKCGRRSVGDSLEAYLALSTACRACIQDEAMYLMGHNSSSAHGAKELAMYGSVADLDAVLRDLEYKAIEGFNSEAPEAGNPFSDNGCATDIGTGRSNEGITLYVDDLGNVGCRSTQSKKTQLFKRIVVTPAEDPPRISFDVNGGERCPRCVDGCECRSGCTGAMCDEPVLQATEDSSLVFNSTFSVAIRDYDTSEVTFGVVEYELTANVTYGTLQLAANADANVVFLAGSKDCSDCRMLTLRGTMCEVNKALQSIVYRPTHDFNSQFGFPDPLAVAVKQIDLEHPDVRILLRVNVKAVNDMPLINPHISGAPVMQVADVYADVLFVRDMDAIPPSCVDGSAKCVQLFDADACEANYRAAGVPAATAEVPLVKKGLADQCLSNASAGVGAVTLRVTCEMGSVWFFSSNLTTQMGEEPQGKKMQELILTEPISWFLGGTLRYYASTDFARDDRLALSISDNGNTGVPPEGEEPGGFCCCSDAACSSCASGPCQFDMQVTACRVVPGYQCKDSVVPVKQLKGWEIATITFSVFAFVFGVIGFVVWVGSYTTAKKFEPVDEATEAAKIAAKQPANGKGGSGQQLITGEEVTVAM